MRPFAMEFVTRSGGGEGRVVHRKWWIKTNPGKGEEIPIAFRKKWTRDGGRRSARDGGKGSEDGTAQRQWRRLHHATPFRAQEQQLALATCLVIIACLRPQIRYARQLEQGLLGRGLLLSRREPSYRRRETEEAQLIPIH